jgi:hypothetical protein
MMYHSFRFSLSSSFFILSRAHRRLRRVNTKGDKFWEKERSSSSLYVTERSSSAPQKKSKRAQIHTKRRRAAP